MTRYTNFWGKNRIHNQCLMVFLTKYSTGVNDYMV